MRAQQNPLVLTSLRVLVDAGQVEILISVMIMFLIWTVPTRVTFYVGNLHTL